MLYKNICGVFCVKTSHTLWGHQIFILHLVKMAFYHPFNSPVLAGVRFPDLECLLDCSPLEILLRGNLFSQASGLILYPHPELWKHWAWPLRGPSS